MVARDNVRRYVVNNVFSMPRSSVFKDAFVKLPFKKDAIYVSLVSVSRNSHLYR